MRLEVAATAVEASRLAARLAADALRDAIAVRARASIAVSGGATPARMLEYLAGEALPWESVDLFQVDERRVAADSAERNLRGLVAAFGRAGNERVRIHAIPVELAEPGDAARNYAGTIERVLGTHGALDVVHLGLGGDGHTASLVPGDPALDSTADVAVCREYAGAQRLTLTFRTLDRARLRIWLVTGEGKQRVLARLIAADPELVATRVRRDNSVVVADAAAAAVARQP
jgi:6-phosphogluconolactonase